MGCSNLAKLTIGDHVESIGNYAFRFCSALVSVVIPDGVTTIGSQAFSGCSNLTSITIPGSVESIGDNAFYGCDKLTILNADGGDGEYVSVDGVLFNRDMTTLIRYPAVKLDTSYTIPDTVTDIAAAAFYNCSALTSVTIPEGVTTIGNSAFYGCTGLTGMTLPEGVTSIGNSAFWGCTNLTSIDIPDSVTTIGSSAFYNSGLVSITIPNSVTNLSTDHVFGSCSKLVSVTLPDSVTTLGRWEFYSCENLTSINIPEGVTKISGDTFYSCSSLTSVTNTFYSCSSLTSVTIPEGVTIIERAFPYCTGLTDIIIPDSVTNISGDAFSSCTGLTSVTLPDGINVISNDAFYNCTGVTHVSIGDIGSNITSAAFAGFKNLSSVTVRASADELSYNTLNMLGSASGGIQELRFEGTNYFTYSGSDYTAGHRTLTEGNYYVDESGVLYRLNDDGTASLLGGPEGIENYSIPSSIPAEQEAGTPYKVTDIGDYAFYQCGKLAGVTIPEGVTDIGDHAFSCTALTGVTIPESVTSIGKGAFACCAGLSQVNYKGQQMEQLSAVLTALSGVGANLTTFFDTALYDSTAVTVTTEPLEAKDPTGRNIKLTTDSTELLTGQSAKSTLEIDAGEGMSNSVVRVYFRFDDGHGAIGYDAGMVYQFEGTDGTVVNGKVWESDSPNIYYVEIEPMKPGQTLSLGIDSAYENIFSGGGTALIWLSVLSEQEAEQLGDGVTTPEKAHLVRWKTQANDFKLEKRGGYGVSIIGNGTENGMVTVRNLYYTISMNRNGQTNYYGKDYMSSVDFVDTLELPDECHWRGEVLTAIQNGQWTASRKKVYVNINGVLYELCTFSSDVRDVRLSLDADGKVQICWTYYNSSEATEIGKYETTMTIGDYVIEADVNAIKGKLEEQDDPNAKVSCVFTNKVTSVEHFHYSEDQTDDASASNTIAIGAASFDISKTFPFANRSLYMGMPITYTITLSNSSSLPYTTLERVEDPLNNYFYITPADMETMFYKDTYGKLLTITIENATLCQSVDRSVVGTCGKTFEITQQYEGNGVPYSGKYTGKDNAITEDAVLTIGWSEDKSHLVLTVNNGDGEKNYTISQGDIGKALEAAGYLVTEQTNYTCDWNQHGQTLYSGQNRSFYVRATVKDTFMRLSGDRDWFIVDNETHQDPVTYQSDVRNGATAFSTDDSQKTAISQSVGYILTYNGILIYRDFSLHKYAYLNGQIAGDSTTVESGDVLTYQTVVKHCGTNSYDALPMADHMSGGQVLLVSAKKNPSLAEVAIEKGLETKQVGSETYYILNKEGTYNHIVVGNYLADRVEITQGTNGIDTMIYWYLTEVGGNGTIAVSYQALVGPEYAGLTLNSGTYGVSNEVWLNDHQTHRLYDRAFVRGTILKMNKYIVTNIGEEGVTTTHDSGADELEKRCSIKQGDAVTYRLMLEGVGEDVVTVNGAAMYDELPASLNGYWEKETNVNIAYVTVPFQTGETTGSCEITNPDSWHIEAVEGNPNQQILRWDNDFSVRLDQATLYIYVTLTFPSGEEWLEYSHKYYISDLSNTFHVYQLDDEVFHNLSIEAEALLQKGVYQTSFISRRTDDYYSNTNKESLLHYLNDGQDYGLITYYVALYNSGLSRMYLSDIQDVLPRGFTMKGLNYAAPSFYTNTPGYDRNNRYYYDSMVSIKDPNRSNVTYKLAYIQYSTSVNENGQQVVTFSLGNSVTYGGNLSYDKNRDKYYLNPGEAVVIAYHCRTNSYADSDDVANNIVSMPYYDYNGAGLVVDQETAVDRKTLEGKTSNNGDRSVQDNSWADTQGMNTANTNNATQWLTSEVQVDRGRIMPGITKQVESPFTTVEKPIKWTVTATNTGTDVMRDYTLTDVMMAPYQFTGTVSYDVKHDVTNAVYTEGPNLFTFAQRSQDDQSVTITSGTGKVATLPMDGTPQEIQTALYTYGVRASTKERVDVTLIVSLKRDDNGNEILSIRFPEDGDDAAAIWTDGRAIMTLWTQNFTGKYSNRTFVNTCYLTPSADQPFDTSAVNQGNYIPYERKDSVVSEASVNVSYGYATTSIKSVTENANLHNSATSVNPTNYIVLPDATSTFRYTLTVNNTGGDLKSQAMDQLVIIDNLPEEGDHTTFYKDIPRFSEFRVDFDGSDPQFAFCVDGEPLNENDYTLQFSKNTDFDIDLHKNDWNGTSDEGWYRLDEIKNNDSLSLSEMRSFRVAVNDQTGTLIPADARITVSFNARINGNPKQAQTAWNSFGYHYSLVTSTTELEAAPQKVGIKIPSVPSLVKKLVDVNGDAYAAEKNETFEFVIYEGEPISLPDGFTKAEVLAALEEKGCQFTIVPLTVLKGASASETKTLDGLWCCDGTGNETETAWIWKNLEKYTLVELSQDTNSNYYMSSDQSNNSRFYYISADPIELVCTNVRDSWNLKVIKRDTDTEEPLSGAVFGLYTQKRADQISEQAYQTLTENLKSKPDTQTTDGEATWYLKDIRTTDVNGEITWKALIEDSYYLLELQAPEGHKLSDTPGQTVEKPAADADKTVMVVVRNQEVKDLTISKTVTGNAGSRDKYFKFTVTLSNVAPGEYTVDLSHADASVRNNGATLEAYKGMTNPETLTVAANREVKQDFYLQHGQSITITGLTKGTSYVVTEAAEDYISTVTGRNASGTITTDDVTVAFVNSRNIAVPTSADSIPYTAMMLFAILPVIMICKRRRRQKGR